MFKKSKALKDPGDFDHGYNYALFLLNLSMRTVAEVEEKMTKRGYVKPVVKEVINRLLEDKYLDDENYAEVFINSMKNYKTWGRFMMKKKMYERKLPKDLIEEKLEELVSEQDEIEIASRYVQKTFGDLSEVKRLAYEDKQKIVARLANRGFGFGLIKQVIE
jgi:regulatory protein